MATTAPYQAFFNDRRDFFSAEATAVRVRNRAAEKDFSFLANNRFLIEKEFDELFTSLQKKGQNRDEFWLYCYYCCLMLQHYYTAYDKKSEAENYRFLGEKISHRIEQQAFPVDADEDEETFLTSFRQSVRRDLGNLASTPKHVSKIRDWLGFTNIYRIHFTFCRLFVKQSLLFVKELQWLEQLQNLAGRNIDEMVNTINTTASVFNVLSVGLFAARLIINTAMLLKHTLVAPTAEEQKLAIKDRFYQELYKRHCTMLNDVAWGTVNLLTNYSAIFHLSAPVANWLTAGFLCFDVSLLLYRHYLAEKEYEFKKAQYTQEKLHYHMLLEGTELSLQERKKYEAQLSMLDDQLAQHDIKWKATSANLSFNVGGAMLLMAGFTASFLIATPAAAIACYFVCTLAVAMYLTADLYGKYKEKSLILQQYEREGINTSVARLEMQSARNDFMIAMAKNIIMPLLIVTTFAVCWQAAVALVILYVGYECLHGYCSKKSPQTPRSPLPPPVDGALIADSSSEDSDSDHDEDHGEGAELVLLRSNK